MSTQTMGPEYGTDAYKQQVETIRTVIGGAAADMKEAERMSMLYIMDTSFSRAAICQALKEVKTENGW